MLLLGKRACVGTGDYDVFLDHIHSWNRLVTENRYVSPCVRIEIIWSELEFEAQLRACLVWATKF